MNTVGNSLSPAVMHALGLTIIHTIWQGAALALAFAALSALLRRSSALIRYALGLILLAAMFTLSVLTFASLVSDLPSPEPIPLWDLPSLPSPIQPQGNPAFLSALNDFCHRHAPQVAFFWLAGVLVLTLRLTGAWAFSRKIKKGRFYSASRYWQARLQWLCQRINLKKKVCLGESRLVSTPLTIGHFKPIVLFPVGLLAGMPPAQVEALLAHELAHILRRDYLVNILQNLADILYFYHPALRWVSSRIRQERENCCDDLSAAVTGDALQVARALANAQEWAVKRPNLALGALAKKNKMLQRIRRLTQMKKERSLKVERFFSISLIILFLAAAGLSANGAAVKKRPPEPPQPAVAPASPVTSQPEVPAPSAAPESPAPPTAPAGQEEETARLKAEIAALRKQVQELVAREKIRYQQEKVLKAGDEHRLQEELQRQKNEEEMKWKEQERLRIEEERQKQELIKEHELDRIKEEKLRQERMIEPENARLIAEKKLQEELKLRGEVELLLKEKTELQLSERLKKIEEELAVISASILKLNAQKAALSGAEKARLKAAEEKTAKIKKEPEQNK